MKQIKSIPLTVLLVSFSIFINDLYAASRTCRFDVKNCSCRDSNMSLKTYDYEDNAHHISYGDYTAGFGRVESVSCNNNLCDLRYSVAGVSTIKGDFCGNLTIYGLQNTRDGLQACNPCN